LPARRSRRRSKRTLTCSLPQQAANPAAQGGAAAAPTVESSAPPSKTLERALKLYDSEDYYMSSIELNKVVEGQSGDDEGNKQRAEFFMGKTLFNLKFYSASLSYFNKIVDKGPVAPLLPEDAAVAGFAVSLPSRVGRRAREDRQVQSARS
jgi:TolA-binding protein